MKFLLFFVVVFLISEVRSLEKCMLDEAMNEEFHRNPSLRGDHDEVIKRTQRFIDEQLSKREVKATLLRIPIVWHVLTPPGGTPLSRAVLEQELLYLNQWFSATNVNYESQNSFYRSRAATADDLSIQFEWAVIDLNGNPFNGVEFITTPIASEGSCTSANVFRTSNGGVDPWDPSRYLNVYSCELVGNNVGFATLPASQINPHFDGLVMTTKFVGDATFSGSTSAHEIGHWLNVLHTFGDGASGCSTTDNVNDTPTTDLPALDYNSPETACVAPGNTVTRCTEPVMSQNIMDYNYENCIAIWSKGQAALMRGTLTDPSSIRFTIPTSDALAPIGTASSTPSASSTPASSKSSTPSRSLSGTPSNSFSSSTSRSNSGTPSNSPTPTISRSSNPSSSNTPSNSPTPSTSHSNTPAISSTSTKSISPSNSPSNSPTPSNSPSHSPTPSNSPSNSPTPSNSPSNSPTPSNSPSNSPTPSKTPSNSPTPSTSHSTTKSTSNTPSNSPTPSTSHSTTKSASNTPSNSRTPSRTPSNSGTPSQTPSISTTSTASSSPTPSRSFIPSPSSIPIPFTGITKSVLIVGGGGVIDNAGITFFTAGGEFDNSVVVSMTAFSSLSAPITPASRQFVVGNVAVITSEPNQLDAQTFGLCFTVPPTYTGTIGDLCIASDTFVDSVGNPLPGTYCMAEIIDDDDGSDDDGNNDDDFHYLNDGSRMWCGVVPIYNTESIYFLIPKRNTAVADLSGVFGFEFAPYDYIYYNDITEYVYQAVNRPFPVFVDVPVPVPVPIGVNVPYPVYVDHPVQVPYPVDAPYPRPVGVPVPNPIMIEVPIPVPVPVPIEHPVPFNVPVQVIQLIPVVIEIDAVDEEDFNFPEQSDISKITVDYNVNIKVDDNDAFVINRPFPVPIPVSYSSDDDK